MAKSRKKFQCLDCKVDTGKIHEHYFVKTKVWLSVVHDVKGMLCVSCLEGRLKRKLKSDDFTACTLNNPKYEPKSQRLMERMNE